MTMNNVIDFLTQVNQRDVDRWQRWSGYRNTLTHYLVSVLSSRSKSDVLIIGSGSLDDLDLKAITPHTKTITFLDLDQKATEEGYMRQGFAKEAFSIIKQDITRFDDVSFFKVWNQFIKEEPNYAEAILFTNKLMEKIYEKTLDQVMDQRFDVIIVLPIFTQLIYHEWTEILKDTHPKSWTPDELSKVNTFLLDLMVPLMDHVNQGIKHCLRPSFDLLALSDMIEWNKEDWHAFVTTYPDQNEKDLTDYYLSYVNQYGMGLGDYGLWSLKEGLLHHDSHFLIWPFSHDRTMLVQFMHLKK